MRSGWATITNPGPLPGSGTATWGRARPTVACCPRRGQRDPCQDRPPRRHYRQPGLVTVAGSWPESLRSCFAAWSSSAGCTGRWRQRQGWRRRCQLQPPAIRAGRFRRRSHHTAAVAARAGRQLTGDPVQAVAPSPQRQQSQTRSRTAHARPPLLTTLPSPASSAA